MTQPEILEILNKTKLHLTAKEVYMRPEIKISKDAVCTSLRKLEKREAVKIEYHMDRKPGNMWVKRYYV